MKTLAREEDIPNSGEQEQMPSTTRAPTVWEVRWSSGANDGQKRAANDKIIWSTWLHWLTAGRGTDFSWICRWINSVVGQRRSMGVRGVLQEIWEFTWPNFCTVTVTKRVKRGGGILYAKEQPTNHDLDVRGRINFNANVRYSIAHVFPRKKLI